MAAEDTTLENWQDLISLLDGSVEQAEVVYRTILVPRYAEQHRKYHTLEHIGRCLEALRCTFVGQSLTAQLAIWFHDVIYDPRRKDNESRSADVLVGACALMGISRSLAQDAASAVIATHHTGHSPPSTDVRQTLDADLSSLGTSWEEFLSDTAAIRQEYEFVSDEQWRTGRVKVLKSFLSRPQIFYTDAFRTRFESKARSNLSRAIADLEGRNCVGVIPGTFIVCGEGRNFCSVGCQKAADSAQPASVIRTYTLKEFVEQAKKDLDGYDNDWSGSDSNDFHRGSHRWTEWYSTFFKYYSWEER